VRKRWLLSFALALATPASAANSAVPTAQTCRPASLPLTFVLPADWSCEGAPPFGDVTPGAKAGGVAPGYVVQLNIYEVKAPESQTISGLTPGLLAAVRREFTNAPNLVVAHASTKVGVSFPALLITVSYRGASLQGPSTISHVEYFFIADGELYEFDYSGSKQWVTKGIGSIRASARSIHFPLRA
jgi:hypothetical protein